MKHALQLIFVLNYIRTQFSPTASQASLALLEIRSFTTTILGFSRPEIGGRGIPRRKKVCFSRPQFCGRDRQHLSRPQLQNCGRDRCYLSRPQNVVVKTHFFTTIYFTATFFCRERPHNLVVKDLISSSVIQVNICMKLCSNFNEQHFIN